MRKLALALALLFCADIALDSFDASCAQAKPDQPCHACFCTTPVLPSPAVGEKMHAPKPTLVALTPAPFAERLIDKTLFRPPIAAA